MQLKLVGADPEVWLTKDSKIISCVGLIGGTKTAPKPVPKSSVGLKVQEDGVALEFNFDPVNAASFAATVSIAQTELQQYITSTLGKEYSFVSSATAKFDAAQLTSEQAITFGCDQDSLAHERGEIRPALTAKQLGEYRCAGGHIHFGYDKTSCQVPEWALIQGIEAFGYLRLLRKLGDRQGERRKYYGLPGLYRSKPYGVEYRTPSNRWLEQPTYVNSLAAVADEIISKPIAYQTLYQRTNWDAVQAAVMAERVGDVLWQEVSDGFNALSTAPKEE